MKFSTGLQKSIQPRKQRSYKYKAPKHVQGKFVYAHLSPALRKQYNTRSLRVRTGDSVVIMRGTYAKHKGKVESVKVSEGKAIISGIEVTKRDGSKSTYPITVSNLMITELKLDDARRKIIVERNNERQTPKEA